MGHEVALPIKRKLELRIAMRIAIENMRMMPFGFVIDVTRFAQWIIGLALLFAYFASHAQSPCGPNCNANSAHALAWMNITSPVPSEGFTYLINGPISSGAITGYMNQSCINRQTAGQAAVGSGYTYTYTCTGNSPYTAGEWGIVRSFNAASVRFKNVRNSDGQVDYDVTIPNAQVATAGCDSQSLVGENGSCYCPTGMDWSVSQNACRSTIDRWHDSSSCKAGGTTKYGNPILPLLGAKSLSVDIGISIGKETLVLTYDSRRQVPSVANAPTVNGSTKFRPDPMPSFGQYWEGSLHKTVVVQRDAGTYIKAMSVSRGNGQWVSFGNTSTYVFTADPGVTDRLERVPTGTAPYQLRFKDALGNQEVYDFQATGSASSLKTVAYASGGSLTYVYSDANTPIAIAPAAGLLISVQDHQGRLVQFVYEQPASTAQRPRVKQVIDPNGRTTAFSYNAAGGLTQITWPDGKLRQYVYERADLPWALTGVIDEKASRLATYAYDTAGRAIDTQLALGVDHYSVTYGAAPSWTVVDTWDATNNVLWRDHYWQSPQNTVLSLPNGQVSNLGVTSVNGSPFLNGQTRPAGSGCANSSSALVFDTVGNVLSEDDFDGSRGCHAYDAAGRNLEVVLVQGLAGGTSGAVCSTVLASNAALPANSRKFSTQWHPSWGRPTIRAAPGSQTTTVYNGQADPFNGGGVATCVNTNPALPDGAPLPVVCKKALEGTLDPTGKAGFSPSRGVDADASFANVSLLLLADLSDGANFVDASSYARVHAASTAAVLHDASVFKFGNAAAKFDAIGKYLQYANTPEFAFGSGDFTIDTWAYFTQSAARAYIYSESDASGGGGQMALLRGVANTVVAIVVNSTDVVYTITSAAVPTNAWMHIALVRSGTSLKLFVGGVLAASTTLPAGTALRPPLGHPTVGRAGDYSSSYGGTYGSYMIGNLDEFRVTKGVARYSTNFTPPGSMGIVDGSITRRNWTYTYDSAGRVLTATDPRGNTTTNTYYLGTVFTGVAPNEVGYTSGDLQTSANASGHVTTFNQYDRSGRLLRTTDPNSAVTVITYTARGLVSTVSVTPAGGSARLTAYTYDNNGQRTQAAMRDGTTLTYTYDAAHRLTSIADAVGNKVSYTLDNMGNRTAEDLKDPLGVLARSIGRVFDALNRPQTVTGATP